VAPAELARSQVRHALARLPKATVRDTQCTMSEEPTTPDLVAHTQRLEYATNNDARAAAERLAEERE